MGKGSKFGPASQKVKKVKKFDTKWAEFGTKMSQVSDHMHVVAGGIVVVVVVVVVVVDAVGW